MPRTRLFPLFVCALAAAVLSGCAPGRKADPVSRPDSGVAADTAEKGAAVPITHITYQDFLSNETRYSRLARAFPERAKELFAKNQEAAEARYEHLTRLVELYK